LYDRNRMVIIKEYFYKCFNVVVSLNIAFQFYFGSLVLYDNITARVKSALFQSVVDIMLRWADK
jgi:hypothetical protein